MSLRVHNLFCTHCSVTYDMDDESVRHKQKLSVPQQTEPDTIYFCAMQLGDEHYKGVNWTMNQTTKTDF